MRTKDFKKGRRVKIIPWKKAEKICDYGKNWDHIEVPFGDGSGKIDWEKEDFNSLKGKILIMDHIDVDGDIMLTSNHCIQPILLIPAAKLINFKQLLLLN